MYRFITFITNLRYRGYNSMCILSPSGHFDMRATMHSTDSMRVSSMQEKTTRSLADLATSASAV